jgi:integrase
MECPQCNSDRLYKDGLRYLPNGDSVQRFLCRNCGYRFSEPVHKLNVAGKLGETLNSTSDLLKRNIVNSDFAFQEGLNDLPFSNGEDVASHKLTVIGKQLNTFPSYNSKRQVCALDKKAKNLIAMETEKQTVAGTSPITEQDAKGLIIEYAWKMKKRGQAETTIETRIYRLNKLVQKGADLMNPDSVETVLATENWTQANKRFFVMAYLSFTRAFNIAWKPIKTHYEPRQAFIPLEKEIDALISGCGKTTSTFLQTLKDTGARAGEGCKLKWIDVNTENNTISINNPEKGSKSRTVKVSTKTIAMINALPKKSEYIFTPNVRVLQSTFARSRKRLARTLQNPRLLQIHFHTLRHWKGTMEYSRTKNILWVKQLLGHKRIENTEVYTHLVNFEDEEYHSATAQKVEEAKQLIEKGFEYVCDMEGIKLFRKRK